MTRALLTLVVALLACPSALARDPHDDLYDSAYEPRSRVPPRARSTGLGVATTALLTSSETAANAGATGRLQLGVDVSHAITEAFELALGFRWLTSATTDDELVSTEAWILHFGPRLLVPISARVAFVIGVDLEATKMALEVHLPENPGEASDWAFGAVPHVGFDFVREIGQHAGIGMRLLAGWGVRASHGFHAVRLRAEGERVEPLDMGSTNLSGLELGLALRMTFR